jgi:hypothetical protein
LFFIRKMSYMMKGEKGLQFIGNVKKVGLDGII